MKSFRMVLSEPTRQQNSHLLGFSMQNYNHERSILGSRQMDSVLELIGQYLHDEFPSEIPFYLRGGRFALVGSDPGKQEELTLRVKERFRQPWTIEGANLRFYVSFAYIDTGSDLKSPDRIMNNLVIALDNARRSPSSALAGDPHNPLDIQQVDEQVDLLRLVENAIEHDCVEIFLQPLVNSRTRKVEGAEALARIRDDSGQIVSPGLFIPVAEKSGHIIELGRQVLRKTCAFVHSHDMDALGIRWVNVNLSPIQCMQQDVATQIGDILAEFDVAPHLIHLEITEQSIVDFSLLKRQISSLEEDGFTFVLDDYGTGYSNLTRVKHYPFTTIKLDMEIVWDYFHDHDDLLPSIVQGFKGMGMSITAEGIESVEMADELEAIGCDYLQGFYFSKPLPIDEFEAKYGC